MSSILICSLYLITPINADLLANLPADQESIYTSLAFDLRPFEESYPELLWVKGAFWPEIIGCSDDYVIMSVRCHSSVISLFSTDGSDDVMNFEVGWQNYYNVSVQEDTLYVVSTGASSAEMDLYVVSISTGEVIRSLYIPAPSTSPPILYDDQVIVSLIDGYLVSLKQDTVVWADSFEALSTGPIILHDSMLLFGTSDSYIKPGHYYEWYIRDPASITDINIDEPSFVALDPSNGESIWKTTIPDHVAGPVYIVEGIIYVSLNDGSLIAMDIDSGDLRWQKEDCVGQYGRFAVNEDYLICSNQTGTRCLDPEDGSEIWSSDLIGYDGLTEVWKDIVFIFDGIYLAAFDGNTGERLWHFNRGWSDGIISVHDNLIITSGRDHVFCLEMKPID